MTRVGIYTRLSRDPDGTATATARQDADCRAFAAREGWTVVETFEDSDLSGFKRDVRRPDYERMLDALERGAIDAVLVWKLDRLSRQPGQFEQVVETCERVGARIYSVHESADMTSPAGLAMMRVGMAFAALESETTSLRTRRAKAEHAEQGRPNGGGLRPFGLTADKLAIVPAEAALIREAAERVIGGEGLRAIAADWERRGVVTTRGNPWTVTALRRMLVNPRLAGARVHRGRVIPSDVIPAILDAATLERVQSILHRPAAPFVRRPRALSGLVRCARCGERMKVKHRQSGAPQYRCFRTPGERACGRMVAAAEPLEELVGAAIAAALDTPQLSAALDDDETAGIDRELAALRDRRETLVHDHYVTGVVTRGDFVAAHARLEDMIGRLEHELARRRRRELLVTLAPGETVALAWASRPHEWRRELAATVLERVVIAPAPVRGRARFDPDRVSLVWRR